MFSRTSASGASAIAFFARTSDSKPTMAFNRPATPFTPYSRSRIRTTLAWGASVVLRFALAGSGSPVHPFFAV